MRSVQSEICSTPTVVWSIDLGQSPIASLLITDDLVLVPMQVGQLRALNLQDGGLCWQKTFEHAEVSGLATAMSDTVLVATYSTDLLQGHGTLVAFDSTGVERWRWSPAVQRVSSPAVAGEIICVTVDSKELVALEAATGQERTRVKLGAIASPSAPALIGDVAYIPCRGPHLLAVGLEGVERWHTHIQTDPGTWLDKTPVVVGDRLFTVLVNGAVLALRAEDGTLVWCRDVGPAGRPLSPPATDGLRLFVGARDGLHALKLADGHPLWHLSTERKIVAPSIAVDGVVYAVSHDHRVYALDSSSGQEIWSIELGRRIEVAPAVGADLVLAADRSGRLIACERWVSAETYARQGCWAEAANAYRLNGELATAARIYKDRLDRPLLAAELWEAAGEAEQAATCYAEAGRYERAEGLYLQIGSTFKAAEMACLQDAYERAAQLYEQGGAWTEALESYILLSERYAAAQPSAPESLYRLRSRATEKRVMRDRLRDLLVEHFGLEDLRQLCFDLEIDYETLSGEEKTAKTRALIHYLERRGCLASLIQVGQQQRPDVPWDRSLQASKESPYLIPEATFGGPYSRKIADLSAKLGEWERAGQEWAAMGMFESAAEAFIRAAHQAEQDTPCDEARLANLWAAAEMCYEEIFDEDQAAICHRLVARYRQLPCIAVQIGTCETMIRDRYASIQLELHNEGGGAAHHVIVHHTLSDFVGDLGKTQEILGLAPDRTLRQRLFIRPTASGTVPLWITVDYADASGYLYQTACRAQVVVLEPD